MRTHSKKSLWRWMMTLFAVIFVFGLSGCTNAFCTSQDRANQLFASYGNLYNSTLLLDENYEDSFDYKADNSSSKEDAVELLKKQNQNRQTLITSITGTNGGYNTWYNLVNEDGSRSFLEYLNEKAIAERDATYVYWTNGDIDDIEDVDQAKAIAWHVAIYAGIEDEEMDKHSVGSLFSNLDKWYAEALEMEEFGFLRVPSDGFMQNLKTVCTNSYASNTACISPVDGVFTQNGAKIYVEGKTWGQAFSEYGFLEGLFVYPLAYIVHAISEGLGNNGWAQILAIFVVTIMVRIISMISAIYQSRTQIKQQRIQPLLNDLQKKYPDNQTDPEQRQMMAKEQARIMKSAKIHPFVPFLFMIVQFPLFLCVWAALQGSASLAAGNWYGLSLTTPVSNCFTSFANTPGAIVGILIFIVMTIANILSSCTSLWLTSWRTKNFALAGSQPQKDKDGNAIDPNKSMKIMTYVMMAFIIIMGWNLPSGMGIYWFIGAILSIAQTLIMEILQTRSRHKARANTGDGTDLAAIRRSRHHVVSAKSDKKKGKNDNALWR